MANAENLNFEWHTPKAQSNLRRHGVSFDEARTVFGDPLSITILDIQHSTDEERQFIVGMSDANRLLMVVHSERDEAEVVRIISARLATRRERMQYEEERI